MKLILSYLLLIFILLSCINKDFSTDYTATVSNTTNHKISIFCFDGRKITDSLTIAPNGNSEIANGTKWGIDLHDGFSTRYTGDSVLVVFDDSLSSMHYKDIDTHTAASYYSWASPRNILNQDNFDFTYTDQSRYHRTSKYMYTFVEKDYQDAEP